MVNSKPGQLGPKSFQLSGVEINYIFKVADSASNPEFLLALNKFQ